MVLHKGAAIRRPIAMSGAKAAHRRTEQSAPAPRRERRIQITSTSAAAAALVVVIACLVGQQVLATVMQVGIVVGTKTAVATVSTVIAATVTAPQTQTKEIPIVVRRIGEIFEIQMRIIIKVTINRYGGCYDHKLTIFAAMALLILILVLNLTLTLILILVLALTLVVAAAAAAAAAATSAASTCTAPLIGNRVEQRLIRVRRGIAIAVRYG